MKNIIILIVIILFSLTISAQNRNSVWCFGDSAGIDFNNPSIPVPISTGLRTRGSCASIADTAGNLLFYANDRTNTAGDYTTLVYNSQHEIMPNGDSIIGQDWYNEMVILPLPENDSLYYLFFVSSVLGPKGLYYSLVDMNADSGKGDVILKNAQLQNFGMVDCLNAVKHGNGRDWWIFFRRYETQSTTDNKFYSYLLTPQGPINYSFQSIGSINKTNLGQLQFNKEGYKAVFNNYRGLLEIYDFDRCSGLFSNPETIFPDNITGPWPARRSSAFSSNSDLLYVSTSPDTTYLIQYDLNTSNITASADTIWTLSYPYYSGYALKLAPDDKIYFSCCYNNGSFPYPYPDSIYNPINMNLGVINAPNNIGTSCDFQPFSFYLGGKRTYWGLPNNPDYDLSPLAGSPCDTLVGIAEQPSSNITTVDLFVYFHPGWQTAFINTQKITGYNYRLRVYDIRGKEVFSESGKLNPPYFTKNLNCASFAKGMYIVVFETEKEKLTKKFVIE